jgi:hypothetical protein
MRILAILPYIMRLLVVLRKPEIRPAVLHAYLLNNARLREVVGRVALGLEEQTVRYGVFVVRGSSGKI